MDQPLKAEVTRSVEMAAAKLVGKTLAPADAEAILIGLARTAAVTIDSGTWLQNVFVRLLPSLKSLPDFGETLTGPDCAGVVMLTEQSLRAQVQETKKNTAYSATVVVVYLLCSVLRRLQQDPEEHRNYLLLRYLEKVVSQDRTFACWRPLSVRRRVQVLARLCDVAGGLPPELHKVIAGLVGRVLVQSVAAKKEDPQIVLWLLVEYWIRSKCNAEVLFALAEYLESAGTNLPGLLVCIAPELMGEISRYVSGHPDRYSALLGTLVDHFGGEAAYANGADPATEALFQELVDCYAGAE